MQIVGPSFCRPALSYFRRPDLPLALQALQLSPIPCSACAACFANGPKRGTTAENMQSESLSSDRASGNRRVVGLSQTSGPDTCPG